MSVHLYGTIQNVGEWKNSRIRVGSYKFVNFVNTTMVAKNFQPICKVP